MHRQGWKGAPDRPVGRAIDCRHDELGGLCSLGARVRTWSCPASLAGVWVFDLQPTPAHGVSSALSNSATQLSGCQGHRTVSAGTWRQLRAQNSAAPSGCQGHRTVSAGTRRQLRAQLRRSTQGSSSVSAGIRRQLRAQALRTQECSQGSSWVSGLLVGVRWQTLGEVA